MIAHGLKVKQMLNDAQIDMKRSSFHRSTFNNGNKISKAEEEEAKKKKMSKKGKIIIDKFTIGNCSIHDDGYALNFNQFVNIVWNW